MIRLRDILLEIGDASSQPYPYQYFGNQKQATFHSGNVEYIVSFYNPGIYHKNDMEIEFIAQTDDSVNYSISATNLHDQYRVMSTVVDIAKRAINEKKPTVVYFHSEDPRRINMYKRYIIPFLHDYNIQEETDTLVVAHKKGWLQKIKSKFDWTGIDTPGNPNM